MIVVEAIIDLEDELIDDDGIGNDIVGVVEEEVPKMTYAGKYQLTAYTPTGNACADGQMPKANYTAASNDKKLWHRWIYIEGYGDVYVHDTGGMASNVIDIYMPSRNEAINFGRKYGEVYIYE